MKHITIYKLQNNGDQTVVATCYLNEDNTVSCQGDPAFVRNLEREGVRDYSDLTSTARFFPKDGINFLENLRYAFQSGYLVATDIQE